MTEAEEKLMQQFGITVTQKRVYAYQGYTYERLADAVNYARIESEREAAGKTPGGQGHAGG